MDIVKLKELRSKIDELKVKARETDSKKETFKIEQEIRSLAREFEELVDASMPEIPDDVKVHIKVDKVITFDTSDFKSWLADDMLERLDLEGFDLKKELREAINEDLDPEYEIDYADITVTIEDDRLK